MGNEEAEYYKTRLEHTLKHTQESTRLIYLVNGAVLALVYFVVERATSFPHRKAVVVGALLVLALTNLLHALLLGVQHQWYRKIDDAYARSTKAQRVVVFEDLKDERRWKNLLHWISRPVRSTHGLYATMHYMLFAALVVASVAMLLTTDPFP